MATVTATGDKSHATGKADIRHVLARIVATEDDPAALPLRLALGIMILPHGMQKAFGLFGGYGIAGTLGFFSDKLGIPWILGLAVIFSEFVGGLALITGFATRVAAFLVGSVMAGAVLLVHLPNGFFMNWFGNQKGEGIEFHLLALGIAVALIIKGGGRYSVDRKLTP